MNPIRENWINMWSFYSAGNLRNKFYYRNRYRSRFFLGRFDVRICRVLFTSPSADEFQLNSKSAYISKCIHKCINIYECIYVVISDFQVFSWKKKSARPIRDSSLRSLFLINNLWKYTFEARNQIGKYIYIYIYIYI